MADHDPRSAVAPVPMTVDGVDTSDIAAATVTVTDLFAAVINPVTANTVGELYAENAAALANVTVTELLDDGDHEQLVRGAIVTLQDAAGVLLALSALEPRDQDPRVALASALQAQAAETLLALDREHVKDQ